MLKLFITILGIVFCCSNVFAAEDVQRQEALEQFDNDVGGGSRLINTVPPKTQNELFEEAVPPPFMDDDPFYPDGGMEDEFMYRNLRED